MLDFQMSEYSVIGCLAIDARCFPVVREVLPTAEPFASEKCRRAYEAACKMMDSGKVVDAVTLRNAAEVEADFIMECMELVPSCNNAGVYAEGVLEWYRRRRLQEIGEDLQMDDGNANHRLAAAKAALDELELGKAAVKSPYDSLHDFLRFRADVNEGKRQTVKVGFPSLDGVLGGFAQGGLYIVAARPGVGKSALGVAMADMLAKRYRVLYVSLEMTADELNARRVAAFSDAPCSYTKLLFGKTTEQEDAAIINACAALSERQLFISAVSHMTVAELEIQARNAKAQVVIVDYLGLLSGSDRKVSEYERITQISGDLKRLAKRMNGVVIALCQLNRESAGGDTQPKLSQLRSSGAIEQDADGVLLLHRPEYGKQKDEQQAPKRNPIAPEEFWVDIAKNRHGRTGMIKLDWYAPVNRFEDRGGRWTEKSWK